MALLDPPVRSARGENSPGLLFWHFTDQFYRNNGDRIGMVSADELKSPGESALVTAPVLLSGDATTAHVVFALIGAQP